MWKWIVGIGVGGSIFGLFIAFAPAAWCLGLFLGAIFAVVAIGGGIQ